MKHRIIQLTKKEFPQKLKVINNPPENFICYRKYKFIKRKKFWNYWN